MEGMAWKHWRVAWTERGWERASASCFAFSWNGGALRVVALSKLLEGFEGQHRQALATLAVAVELDTALTCLVIRADDGLALAKRPRAALVELLSKRQMLRCVLIDIIPVG